MHTLSNAFVTGHLQVAPDIINNLQFTAAFGAALNRWTFIPVPGFVLNTLLGKERAVMLLEGQRVEPTKALEVGYKFQYPTIQAAFEQLTR
eukprot:m.56733 g.56733  ORF g.56733 m.56733 type:complete len:91 (-) comp13694_c0_seq24:163-435(-)